MFPSSILGWFCLNNLGVLQIYGCSRVKLVDYLHGDVVVLKCARRYIHWVCAVGSLFLLYFVYMYLFLCVCPASGACGCLLPVALVAREFVWILRVFQFCHRGQCCARSCTLQLTVDFPLRLSWARATTTTGDNVILLEHQQQVWRPASVYRPRWVLATSRRGIGPIRQINWNALP